MQSMRKATKKQLLRYALAACLLVPAAFSSAAAAGPSAPADETPVVQVTGTATRQVAPDYALLSLGLSSRGASVNAAKSVNDQTMSSVISRLQQLGIAKNDIRTSAMSVNPEYNYNSTNAADRNKVIGYEVRNTVSVKIKDLSKVSAVIDGVTSAGANEVNGLSFQTDPNQQLSDQLTAEAIRNARHQAEVIASALGLTLGPVKSVSIGGSNDIMFTQDVSFRAKAALGSSTPVEPGEQTATKTASIVYTLK